jgi:hypothetical protein
MAVELDHGGVGGANEQIDVRDASAGEQLVNVLMLNAMRSVPKPLRASLSTELSLLFAVSSNDVREKHTIDELAVLECALAQRGFSLETNLLQDSH